MKRYTILSLLVMLFFSCNDSYLEKLPLDAISTNEYWKTPKDLELYLNQFYVSFPGYGSRGTIYWADEDSDSQIEINRNLQLSGEQTIPASGDGWDFSQIRKVNYFLDNYQNSESEWARIQHYVGEGYFFRAYYYFDLLTKYGDLPWVNKPLGVNDDELYAGRLARNVIADSILADLDKAVEFMSPKASAPNSRINSDIALLLKSRVALYEGTWQKYHSSSVFGTSGVDWRKYLNLAAEASKTLIEQGAYSIYSQGNPEDDYGFLFVQENLDNISEIMLYRKYDVNLDLYHYSHESLVWPRERGITKSMIESYLCKDGLPISKSPNYRGDSGLLNVVANRDPRLKQSIWVPGDPIKIEGNDTLSVYNKTLIDQSGISRDITGYMLKKGLSPYKGSFDQIEIGAPIFRYAEVLLNYAEAKVELGDVTQEDLDITVNILRARVGMPNLQVNYITVDPNWEFPELSALINEIRRERRVELAFEGFRKNDLFRWRAHHLFLNKRPKGAKFNQAEFPHMTVGQHIFVDNEGYIDPYQSVMPNGYQFNLERNYLYPIPTQEITLNNNLTQNPGW